MNTHIKFIFLFTFFAALFYSCEELFNSNADESAIPVTGEVVDKSSCKYGLKMTSGIYEVPDSISVVEYEYDISEHILYLTHINAGFNCCPDSLYCLVKNARDTIKIEEFEKNASCRCNCLYDLDIEIEGVLPRIYFLAFIEPYAVNMDSIGFGVNLAENSKGSFSVIRKNYPWGMNSF